MGRGLWARVRAVFATAVGVLSAWRALGQRGASVIVSVGGYASVPGVVAAALRRLPIALVEPNATPGRANRLAARFARGVFVQFEAATPHLQTHAAITSPSAPRCAGSWSRRLRAAPERRPPTQPIRLLIFGGSQGARQINEAMIEIAPQLDPARFEIFHQTGEADRERVSQAYADTALDAQVVAFEPDMPLRYAESDLAICRSGALTVAELAMAGLPALLVPYPFAADDHQKANADAAARAGAARVLDARPLDAERLLGELRGLAEDPDGLVAMSRAAAGLARPDAARDVVEHCAHWLESA